MALKHSSHPSVRKAKGAKAKKAASARISKRLLAAKKARGTNKKKKAKKVAKKTTKKTAKKSRR